MCLTMLSNRLRFQVMATKELTLAVYLHVIIFCRVQKSDEQVMVSAAISLMAYLGYIFPSELFRQSFSPLSLYLVSLIFLCS